MRRLTILAAVVLGLAGAGGAQAAASPSLQVTLDPFRIAVVQGGTTVVGESADARLRYQVASTTAQYLLTKGVARGKGVYDVATTETGRTARVAVAKTKTGFHVSVRLLPETDVEQVYDAFDTGPNDHFLGAGERGAAVDLRGQVLPVKLMYRCSYAPVPYFASSAGWGLRLATDAVAGLAFPGSPGGTGCTTGGGAEPCSFPPLATRAEVCAKGARLDYDLYTGTFPQVLAKYQADAGQPRVPPPAEFELMKWRDVYEGPAEVLEDITRLRQAGVPIGSVIVDNPWERCVGSLTFDPSRFPDPAGLIAKVHALDVRFMLWVSPKVVCGPGYPSNGILGTGSQQVVDLLNTAVLAEYRRRLRAVFALGVDGVKGDRGDEVELEALDPTLQNAYARLYAEAVLPLLPPGSPSIFRAASMGSQRLLPGLWAGDQPGEWLGLQLSIRQGQTAAMSGFPTWGSDVGGYASAGLTPDVFARWAQLGAVSPVMEVGGIGPNATPWLLGAEAMEALRVAANLHYELYPYFRSILRRREPVLRPLGFAEPTDPQAWVSDLEFLVGPDLLAAPVTGGGTTPRVYLPRGTWVDLYGGVRLVGPTALTRDTPLTQFPLYVRGGSVVPFNLRTATGSWWGVDELVHSGRAGWLATNGATLNLRNQPRNVQIFVPSATRPMRVTIGRRTVAWTWNAAPMPGVVVRLPGPKVAGKLVLRRR